MFKYDPQDSGPQFLENLATGYWFSETLFTAVEMDVFTFLEPDGGTVEEVARFLKTEPRATQRFLQALTALGLLTGDGGCYYNTQISSRYLVTGKPDYQGDSILWRQYLAAGWANLAECLKAGGRINFGTDDEDSGQLAQRISRYINAMDRVARTKALEILPFFNGMAMDGEILDVGAGSGAVAAGFMEQFPAAKATLMDIPEVLRCTRQIMNARGMEERVRYCPANILEDWPVNGECFDLVILSNIVHAYAEEEISAVLQKASQTLKPGGIMVVHDFFLEHYPAKAALFDLNMFINTYNGKVFSQKWVRAQLAGLGLYTTEMIPLETDTAVIFAAREESDLAGLCLDTEARLAARIREMGFEQVYHLPVDQVHVTDWAQLKCQFGCSGSGQRHCPPAGYSHEETREVLKDYRLALLLEGEPPTGAFQRQVLEAEKEAFKAGYHKALAFWAGPCSICSSCITDGRCRNPKQARPSMEGSGIDVFETVRRAGITLRTLKDREEYVKYYALLLLE